MPSSFNILFITLLLHLFQGKGIKGATFTFVNKCSQTIWPAILGSPTLETTGFQLPKAGSRAFQVPTGWSGRFWGRTGCTFDESNQGSCATGDCASGQLECNGAGATAATLAEFTLGSGSMDFYDVSLVDGYNLPVAVDVATRSSSDSKCSIGGCTKDLKVACPDELQLRNRRGEVVACKSACLAFDLDSFCCRNQYGSPDKCRPNEYSKLFKRACPAYFSYPFDAPSPLVNCPSDDYIVTFCPGGVGGDVTAD